jgi:hypothetical protein
MVDQAVKKKSHTMGDGPLASGFLVAGAGHFGGRALDALLKRFPGKRILAIDRDPKTLTPWASRGVEVYVGEAVKILDNLLNDAPPLWVVPAVPCHLAFDWLIYRLSPYLAVKRIPIPNGLLIPNPYRGPHGDLYSSLATFICPEDCPEPKDKCTVTGKKRKEPLFQILKHLCVDGFRILGLRSRQLAPGVGGYRTWDLLYLPEAVSETGGDFILYTACRCHGVLSGLSVSQKVKGS